jgi:hypothetical protein
VPTIVQLELAKWLAREVGDDEADRVLAFTQICRSHRLATADAIVFATARGYDAALLTCDAHFAALPGVEFVAKTHAPWNGSRPVRARHRSRVDDHLAARIRRLARLALRSPANVALGFTAGPFSGETLLGGPPLGGALSWA